MSVLLEKLAEPLSEFQSLTTYSHAMAEFARGNLETASSQFAEIINANKQVEVSGVTLSIPQKAQVSLSPKSTSIRHSSPITFLFRRNLLLLIVGGLVLTGMIGFTISNQKSQLSLRSKLTNQHSLLRLSGALELGDAGPEVEELQRRLQALGFYSGPVSGYFGSRTESAVIQLQQDSGLDSDGVAGAATIQAINSFSSSQSTSRQSLSVLELQRRLKARGFYTGPLDGSMRPSTQRAITAAQRFYLSTKSSVSTRNSGSVTKDGSQTPIGYFVIIPATGQEVSILRGQVMRLAGDLRVNVIQREGRNGPYVIVGPFSSQNAAESWNRYLKDFGIRSGQVTLTQ